MAARAAVIGTTSTTVIQSSPSMKFTRLTNHSTPINRTMRSRHQGKTGNTRSSGGKVVRTTATAKPCSTNRGAAAIGRLSAIAPTAAIRSTAANMTASGDMLALALLEKNKTPVDTRMVAPITAIPPPWGVGVLWDDREFGFATA